MTAAIAKTEPATPDSKPAHVADRSTGALMRIPWHPFAFAAIVVIGFWFGTAVSPYAAVRSLAIALLIALALIAAGALATRSWQLGALLASGALVLLWAKAILTEPARLIARNGLVAVALFVLSAGALAVAARLLWRHRAAVNRWSLTRLLNRATGLMLAASVILGVTNGAWAAALRDLRQGDDLTAWRSLDGPGVRSPGTPDMYVILLDGYPRSDALDFAFDIDNGGFVQDLADRGFTVATASHSDYLWTHVSVPSALNMAYVEQIPGMEAAAQGRAPLQPTMRWTISDNAVFEAAREHGYAPISVGAGFEQVAPRQADVYVDGGQLNDFEIGLLNATFVGNLVASLAPDFASAQQRARINGNLDILPVIAADADAQPILVFAHIPAPHQPTVFGEHGTPVEVPIDASFFADSPLERGEDLVEYRDRYRAQLPYLNERVLETIDTILDRSPEPPVIVLFADHGSASAVDWTKTTPEEADPARLLERTATLFAALTPGRTDVFPNDISPVDLFRLLFDAYWGTHYGRAPLPEHGGEVRPVDPSVFGNASGAGS